MPQDEKASTVSAPQEARTDRAEHGIRVPRSTLSAAEGEAAARLGEVNRQIEECDARRDSLLDQIGRAQAEMAELQRRRQFMQTHHAQLRQLLGQ